MRAEPTLADRLAAAEDDLDTFHSWLNDCEEPLSIYDDRVLANARTTMELAAARLRKLDAMPPRVTAVERARQLFTDPDTRLSARQVADRLHVSHSCASTALRTLGDSGEIRKHGRPGRITWSTR